MLTLLVTAAHAGNSCETTCKKLGPCVGDEAPASIAQCAQDCGSMGLPSTIHDAVAQASGCDAALMAFTMGMLQASGEGGAQMQAAVAQLQASQMQAGQLQGGAQAPGSQVITPQAPAQGGPAGGGACRRPSDAQWVQLMTSSAWCSYSYSGSTEKQARYVVSADGRLVGNEQSETVRTGQNTNQYGDVTQTFGAWGASGGGVQACWDIVGGQFAMSQDGVNYAPMTTQVAKNRNGYPILTLNGTEYMQCN